MGFHVCEYCHQETSSGDITLRFKNGRAWQMPDMILHYIADHGFQPPSAFTDDIMKGTIEPHGAHKMPPVRVGYLDAPTNAARSHLVSSLAYGH